MTTKKTTLDIGCISEGTLRPVDIIPELLWALKPLRLTRADRATVRKMDARMDEILEIIRLQQKPQMTRTLYDAQRRWVDIARGAGLTSTELLGFYLSELFDLAENYCPDYCYLGATEGDGACIGVWPIAELFDDTSPGGYDGCLHYGDEPPTDPELTHWVQGNDHGNATLWRRAGQRWVECWSVV